MPSHRNSSPPVSSRGTRDRSHARGSRGIRVLGASFAPSGSPAAHPVLAQADDDARAAERERRLREEFAEPRPVEALNSVRIEEPAVTAIRAALDPR